MLLIYPFSAGILWKIANKKQTSNPTLNGSTSKAKANSESKLKLSESSFTFLSNSLIFCTVHGRELHPRQPLVPLPVACGLQRVKKYC